MSKFSDTMKEVVSSEVREDLGYIDKPKPSVTKKPTAPTFTPRQKSTLDALDALKQLAQKFPEAEFYATMKLQGRTFELWLSSDKWWTRPRNTFGTGIVKLKQMIERALGPKV